MEQHQVTSLLNPRAFPEPTDSVELVQTHVSYIFLTDRYAYKVKKPVNLGFLDFSTLDQRRYFCEEEVRLNSRLCPGLYLGVVELRETENGCAFHGSGTVLDVAVKMRRLPEECMLDRLITKGMVHEPDIREIARTIAAFHANAEQSPAIDYFGSMTVIAENWAENFSQVASFSGVTITPATLRLLQGWVERFMTDKSQLFRQRVAERRIRDCDGDIHLENICLADRIWIFDCIEFNSRFRYGDTAADIAFFLMDLDFHDAGHFAASFLDEYIACSGDRGVLTVLDFYKVYRAFVRGKVAGFRLQDPGIPDAAKEVARHQAHRYFDLARSYVLREAATPILVITCGLMGSGKTTIASLLAEQLGFALLRSDAVRKELTGVPAKEHRLDGYGEGIYTNDLTTATYERLQLMAEAFLCQGRGVVIDASFRKRSDRDSFHLLANRIGIPFRLLQVTCPELTIRSRLERRLEKADEVSDGRWELLSLQQADFEPPAPPEEPLTVDSTRAIEELIEKVLADLGMMPC